jgi:release factor glutamine methyltransferase
VPARGVVLDLCCGCGALGTALGTGLPGIEVHAADVDPAAVACARRNLARVGGHVHRGDLFAPVPPTLRGRVDVLVANVPYVPTAAIALMPPEARDHEPRLALDGGPDGLDVARRVIADAPDWLAPGGSLLFETSEDQAPAAVATVAAAGLAARLVTDDDRGATVVIGVSRP